MEILFLTSCKINSRFKRMAYLCAVDSYIAKPSAETVILNDKPFVFQPEKTDLTKSLNGVFAFAGAEKWVFADHLLNVPMATIATTPAEAKNIEKEKIDRE